MESACHAAYVSQPIAHPHLRHRRRVTAAAGDATRTPRRERARPDYAAWIAEVDRRVEKAARVDLSRGYSFVAAWREGMSPSEAIREAVDWLLAR
jgi:hypothetical protein